MSIPVGLCQAILHAAVTDARLKYAYCACTNGCLHAANTLLSPNSSTAPSTHTSIRETATVALPMMPTILTARAHDLHFTALLRRTAANHAGGLSCNYFPPGTVCLVNPNSCTLRCAVGLCCPVFLLKTQGSPALGSHSLLHYDAAPQPCALRPILRLLNPQLKRNSTLLLPSATANLLRSTVRLGLLSFRGGFIAKLTVSWDAYSILLRTVTYHYQLACHTFPFCRFAISM